MPLTNIDLVIEFDFPAPEGAMNYLRIILVAALLTSAGCAAQGTPYEKVSPETGKAVVYLYRPASISGAALTPRVDCGGATAKLRPGGYHRFVVAAGHIACTSSSVDPGNHELVDLEVTQGHDYYVKETIGMGILVGRVHLALVDPEYGQG